MNLRLLPMLGIAASALLALKVLAFTLGPGSGSFSLNGAVAQENDASSPAEVSAPVSEGEGGAPAPPAAPPDQPVLPDSLEIGGSAAERAVLESLGKRRETLQQQEGQLDLREKLLQATEERIQKRIDELKALEKEIEATIGDKEQQEQDDVASLVTMYENMKPKDAARIFDRLSMPILLKVVRQMKPRKMSAILAKMSPEAAEKLTVAFANSSPEPEEPPMAVQAQVPGQGALPKIPSN